MSALPLFADPKTPVLRPYQRRDADRILAHLARGTDGVIYVLPTGGGKSLVLADVISTVAANHWEAWIFVHRRELIRQLSKSLTLFDVPHGIISPDHRPTLDRVQVCSIDTVDARLDALAPRMAQVRVAAVDEVHHIASERYRRVVGRMPNALRLGLTATPFRLDGRGLGDFFTAAVEGPSVAELIEMGHLLPAAIWAPPAKLDLASVTKRAGDYAVSELARMVDVDEVTISAVRNYARIAPGVPMLGFCVDIEHARHVAEAFTKAGWAAASVDGTMTHRVRGEDGKSEMERDRTVKSFAAGDLHVLTSCALLGEGYDVPAAGGCILLRPTKSTSLAIQQMGRAFRPHPGQTEATIIDMVGNIAEHGMPDERRRWSLAGGIKGLERVVRPTRRCRTCYYVTAAGAERCPRCQRKYPKSAPLSKLSDVELATLPGIGPLSAEDIGTMTLDAVLRVAKTKADLQLVARIRGYKLSWVAHVLNRRAMSPWQRYAR